jgi:hypothetical protein
MFCEKVFGEKEPLDDKSTTHGTCDPCFEEFRVKIEQQQSNYLTGPGGSEGIKIAFQS